MTQQPYWQPQQQQPIYAPHSPYPPQQYRPQPRNGFGITALVVGLIGVCIGLIPLFGLGAIIGGIIAVVFGLLGVGRARKGMATNTVMAVFGTAAGVLALVLGVWAWSSSVEPSAI